MFKLQTKKFAGWITKQHIDEQALFSAVQEIQDGLFDANLGSFLYKKRIAFLGKGKRGSGRTIVCYRRNDRIIFIHGFAKNETSNLSKKELVVLKELAKILMKLSPEEVITAIENGDFVEIEL